VPVDQATASLEELAAGKTGREGFLGVRADMSDAASPESRKPGVVIAEVVTGSPAYRAGIVPRDRIVAFDGRPVDGWDRLTEEVARATPGRSIPVVVLHEGKERVVQLEVADRGHMIWRERQRKLAGGRERLLQNQIEGLRHQLELLRHQLAAFR
jgi:S1-C subfamily serine protease